MHPGHPVPSPDTLTPFPGSDLFLAPGHGMMGVGMSAGTGQLLADLVAGRAPAVDPAAFDPARFA